MTPIARNELLRISADGAVGATGPRGPTRPLRSSRTRTILFALACGGAVGAVAREAVSLAFPVAGGAFPWGTFVINVSGSFALGLLVILLLERFPRSRLARPVIGTGFLGAYTTFSTFMLDAVQLVHRGHPATAAGYTVASLLGGLLAVWVGMVAARAGIRAERWLQKAGR